MKFSSENKCRFCPKLFCCLECRIKHEIDLHFSLFAEFIYCELCNGSEEIVLEQQNTNEFIDHLFMNHSPLQCRNCAVIFNQKIDLTTVHKCVSSEKIENEKLNLKMVLEAEQKIEKIIEEQESELSCEKKQSDEADLMENSKQKSKPYDASVAENVNSNGMSINNSDNANQTPLNNPVRQTSTPMPKMKNEVKRHSYYSMSASSIQVSSIDNSTENDISPPVPVMSNLNTFRQPSRRMPVGVTPYQQIMSRSIQRAFTSHGISRGGYINSTPPLDLRTSPVIRRTISLEANGKPRTINGRVDTSMIDLRTTPVIRRSRQMEGINIAAKIDAGSFGVEGKLNENDENKPNNQNFQNTMQESLQKSSLTKSKSTNTFFETCGSFESSVAPSHQIAETPKTSGISKRSVSFSKRQIVKLSEEDKDQWFTPSPETPTGSTQLSVDPSKVANKDIVDEVVNNQPQTASSSIWSLLSSVFRLTSTGGTTNNNTASNDINSNANSLIKRCASFTGFLPKKPTINLEKDEENPYKRRRTSTLSEVERYSQLGDVENAAGMENGAGRRIQRISGRPPIDRFRQS